MKKISLFMLMAVGLLISGNVGAQNVAKIVETDTEYETFAAALSVVQANQTIKLLADANAGQGNGSYIAIDKAMTLDLDTYTLTIDKTIYYGLYVYANLTIQAAYNSTTGHYGSIYNAKSSASQAALIISDASCTVTVNSGYLHSNGASAVIMQDDDFGVGSLILSANAELHSDGSNYDIEMNGEGSFVTVNGTHDGLRVLVSNFTDGSKITNNGTLTNMKLVENKTNMVYEGSGTYEFTLGSKVSQNTMTALGANATIAEGYVTSLSSGFYTVIEPLFSVNGVGYGDLNEALAVSTEATPAVMLKNVVCPGSQEYDILHNGYLDLNGYELSTASTYGFCLDGALAANVALTILDNSVGKTGVVTNTKSGCNDIFWMGNGSTLTLKGGSVESEQASSAIDMAKGTESVYQTLNIENEDVRIVGADGVYIRAYDRMYMTNGYIQGTGEEGCAIMGQGNNHNTVIEIQDGTFVSNDVTIYHPQYGTLLINGGSFTSPYSIIEMRAGELTINGGTFNCTRDAFGGFKANGSGTTCLGAAIICAQHTTKMATILNLNGGTFTGPVAVAQGNPQENNMESVAKVQVNLNGGLFYGTTQEAVLGDNTRRMYGKGGFYNTDPINYVATGYKSYEITAEDYPTEYAAGYRYRIGLIDQAGEQETTINSGDWKTEATTVWEKGGTTGTEPTDETPVVIENNKQVVVTTPATAYSVMLGTGTSMLTVKETGRLMVGAGGFTGTTDESFIVENGGQMAISPSQAEYQPEATVTFVADWAHRKAAADDKAQGDLVASDLYWQHIATPLSNGIAPTPSETGVSYVNTWNLVNGWTSATWANVITPFVGYQISSIKPSNDKITLTYKGQLVGNHVDPLNFTRIGFSFFGNSYLAPIDIRELLTCLETKGAVDPTVLLYNSESGYYNSINRASYYIPGTIAEIQPMQSFFVFSESATNVDFDYTKAVWNSFCAKAQSGVVVPSAPAMHENPFSAIACIDIKAANGAADRVMLFEGDEMSDAEDKGFDAHKMMTAGVNIYARGSYADLAILATNNLLGSQLVLKTDDNTNYTLSFANIKGEYALYDALTGRTINMVEGATYEFVAQSNATITDRFFVVEAAKVPTTMENVNAQAGSCKFMKNGIMFIERNNNIYNAQGQIVK